MQIRYFPSLNEAHFFGTGTYQARQEIKTLGRANWNRAKETWEVHSEALSIELLKALFPQGEIVVSEANKNLESSETYSDVSLEKEGGLPPPNSRTVNDLARYSVTQILKEVRSVVANRYSDKICVFGIVSQCKKSNGVIFIDLIDEEEKQGRGSQLLGLINREELLQPLIAAGFNLEAGLQIMFEGQLQLTLSTGRVILQITRIVVEYTIAKLAVKREITNKRLKDEGLFNKNKELLFPFVPVNIGILTSESGTVIHDFCSSLGVAKFPFKLTWVPCQVQGSSAVKSVLSGLSKLLQIEDLDLILVFRGGGSAAELSIFSEYELVKAFTLAHIPVLSAIGHQEDQSSIQDISFQSFGVPKDLGRFLADIIIDFRIRRDQAINIITLRTTEIEGLFEDRINRTILNINNYSIKVVTLEEQRLLKTISNVVDRSKNITMLILERTTNSFKEISMRSKQAFASGNDKLIFSATKIVNSSKNTVEIIELKTSSYLKVVLRNSQQIVNLKSDQLKLFWTLISALDPKAILAKGFSITRKKGGGIILSVNELHAGDEYEVELIDGFIEGRTTRIFDKN